MRMGLFLQGGALGTLSRIFAKTEETTPTFLAGRPKFGMPLGVTPGGKLHAEPSGHKAEDDEHCNEVSGDHVKKLIRPDRQSP